MDDEAEEDEEEEDEAEADAIDDMKDGQSRTQDDEGEEGQSDEQEHNYIPHSSEDERTMREIE